MSTEPPNLIPPQAGRGLLRPREVLESIELITPDFLAARGLRGLLLDLDNTLIPYGSYQERAEIIAWAAELRRAEVQLYLLSNATAKRARFWLDKLSFEGVGMAGKPFQRAYKTALAHMQLPPQQVGMVGDQLFTDVLGGNIAGLYTLMVHPIVNNSLPHTHLARRLERLVLKRYGHDWYGKERRTSSQAPITNKELKK
ncbi:YqeG family HAD IIIA-type phosphatase [Deinococcus psychrotolerans]|uniref:YqeG family HAD IIIA-type phosphatase n=1 Tax=Deinococcus psychrotolerans TaxID=2489213 RepID=A0A3G8YEC6_9DEIO|nr:YqeG family HAD IIIA-type phosphatase [Deinococcus psychrotolerans]AZI43190.1 YqeG family HAD IIIA-type phosphatase [Deinococcus psychrotolerans]